MLDAVRLRSNMSYFSPYSYINAAPQAASSSNFAIISSAPNISLKIALRTGFFLNPLPDAVKLTAR